MIYDHLAIAVNIQLRVRLTAHSHTIALYIVHRSRARQTITVLQSTTTGYIVSRDKYALHMHIGGQLSTMWCRSRLAEALLGDMNQRKLTTSTNNNPQCAVYRNECF